MFTGIIEACGILSQKKTIAGDCRLFISSGLLDMSDVHLGDSIATNGVCLTVSELQENGFWADVSNETLAHSTLGQLSIGCAVNLEKAMLATARFGGHIVSGHVDGVGHVQTVSGDGRSIKIEIAAAAELLPYIAQKGSITLDGVSLTVNELTVNGFLLNIVPHTAQQTIIMNYKPGTAVNLEIDVVARYLERLLASREHSSAAKTIDTAFLAKHGFYK